MRAQLRRGRGPAAFCLLSLSVACASAPAELVTSRASAPGLSNATEGETWRDRLVDPVSQPTLFESPVIETNIEPIIISQEFPSDSIFDGGGFNVIAVQARLAITDRFALIATKDGWIDLDPDTGSDETGLADIAGGFKYALIDDPELGLLVTPGLTLEVPAGDDRVFQNNGDGVLRPFVSAAQDYGATEIVANVGYSLPLEGDEESSSVDYHLMIAHEVSEGVSPLIEFNGITYTSDGDALPVDFEGGDLINLGASDVDGNTVISGALGVRWRINPRILFGATYEIPVTSREDLLDSRLTLDVILY